MRLKQYILDINSKYKAFLPLSVLALFILGYALLMATGSETKPISAPERSWSVTAQEAQYGDIQQSIDAFGELISRREVDLRMLVAGEVIETGKNYDDGALVKKGDVLIKIDPFNYKNAVKDTAAQLRGGTALLREREAAYELSKVEYERAEKLFDKGNVAQKYIDDRKLDVTIAESRMIQQKSAVERLDVLVARAKRDLRNTALVAPFDGYISGLQAREGRLLNINEPVATISDANSYEVRFNLSDAQYGRFLKTGTDLVGRPVDVRWNIGGETITLTAILTQVGARISQNTRGVDAIARIDGETPAALRGGAFVNVVLRGHDIPNVVAVQKTALYGDNQIYVIVDDRLQSRQVEIMGETQGNVLISSGVENGEKILLTRFNEASPEVAVKVLSLQTVEGMVSPVNEVVSEVTVDKADGKVSQP
jgi:RND family efflux transporter MFP subunit